MPNNLFHTVITLLNGKVKDGIWYFYSYLNYHFTCFNSNCRRWRFTNIDFTAKCSAYLFERSHRFQYDKRIRSRVVPMTLHVLLWPRNDKDLCSAHLAPLDATGYSLKNLLCNQFRELFAWFIVEWFLRRSYSMFCNEFIAAWLNLTICTGWKLFRRLECENLPDWSAIYQILSTSRFWRLLW